MRVSGLKWFRAPRSLQTRFVLLGFATLIPVTLLTIYSDFDGVERRRQNAGRTATDYTRTLASNVDGFAQGLQATSLATALSLSDKEPGDTEEMRAILQSVADEVGILRAAFVTDVDGIVMVQVPGDADGNDVSDRPYIQELQDGAQSTWSRGLLGLRSGQTTVAHSRQIRGPDGEAWGYLVFAFYPSALWEYLGVTNEGNAVLIDQTGQVLYSSADPEQHFRSLEQVSDENVALALSGREVTIRDEATPFDEGNRYGTFAPLPTMRWALAYTESEAALHATLRNILIRDLAILGLIWALSLAGLLIFARQISRPLASLGQAVRALGEGRESDFRVATRDPELRGLQDAFVTMRREVESRERMLIEQARLVATLERAGAEVASNLDLRATMQAVTDAGTELTEATVGALFYNSSEDENESYSLFTVSGEHGIELEGFPMPRNTPMFEPTFRGDGVVRLADVTQDERYGQRAPHFGMPAGHPKVRAYLAVPVTSRDGSVIGGLFFGHTEPGAFTARHEELACGIASWASLAIDNARLYEKATERQAALEAANREKDEFLGLVSHELRTPITIVLGAANHLIERDGTVDIETREMLMADIRNNASRLSMLVHNVLVLARIEHLGASAEPVLLRPVIERSVREFELRSARQVRLSQDEESAIALGSALYIEQILSNLLSNADKYSPAGLPVELDCHVVGNRVELSVRDFGSGPAEADRERIFEPYYRGNDAENRASGFGLGLAVCRALAESMSGTLVLTSSGDEGTVFTLTLPCVAEGEPAGQIEDPEMEAAV